MATGISVPILFDKEKTITVSCFLCNKEIKIGKLSKQTMDFYKAKPLCHECKFIDESEED